MANKEPTAEALTELYAHVGMLFCVLQTFKYELADLLADQRPFPDRYVPARQIFDDDWGNLVTEFCSVFSAPDDVTCIVKTIPSLINYLTNHCFFDNAKLMSTNAGCEQLRDELQQFYEGIVVYTAFLKDIQNAANQGMAINWETLRKEHDWRRFSETLEPPTPTGRLPG